MDINALALRLERLENESALHRLAHDYCIGADHRDADRWKSVWAPEAQWETSPDRVFVGIDEIMAAVHEQWNTFPIMQHATANHVVDVSSGSDRATGRCDVVVMVQLPDQRWMVGGGSYADDYRRDGGRWRISRRRVVRPFDVGPLATSSGSFVADPDRT